jgi:hypothetical protein
MADSRDAPIWQKMSESLEILANINYVLGELDSNVSGRAQLHDMMSAELAKLISICRNEAHRQQEN